MEKIVKKMESFTICGNWKLVGSSNTRGVLYWSDLDVEDHLKGRAVNIAKHFQEVAQNDNHVVWLELKCGIDKRYKTDARKIRWSREETARGYKNKSGKKFYLSDCVSDDSIMKLDLAVPQAGRWFDVSIRYFYKQKKEGQEDIKSALEDDIDEYKGVDTLKSLKRLYSVYSLEKGNDRQKKELIDFFNSKTGYLNKQRSDLDFLDMLEGHDIEAHLDQIAINLKNVVPKRMIKYVYTDRPILIKYLRQQVEDQSNAFLRSFKME